jgi:hypothetical protein
METVEFNTIKTVGTITKDKNLQKVYKEKFGNYNPQQLTNKAKTNKLADDAINFLKDVFNDVITNKEELLEIYKSVPQGKSPRRYGKQQILIDIKNQNGAISPQQRTMLKLADLKALQGNLASKGVSDIFKGTQKLSKQDLKDINAAIRDFEQKVQHITKRRK